MDERTQLLEIFAEQVIEWAKRDRAQDEGTKLAESIIEFAQVIGLPL